MMTLKRIRMETSLAVSHCLFFLLNILLHRSDLTRMKKDLDYGQLNNREKCIKMVGVFSWIDYGQINKRKKSVKMVGLLSCIEYGQVNN